MALRCAPSTLLHATGLHVTSRHRFGVRPADWLTTTQQVHAAAHYRVNLRLIILHPDGTTGARNGSPYP